MLTAKWVWQLSDGTRLRKTYPQTIAGFITDHKYIADNVIWDAYDEKSRYQLTDSFYGSAAISENKQLVAIHALNRKSVLLFEGVANEDTPLVATLKGASEGYKMAFANIDTLLLVSYEDESIGVWSCSSQLQLNSLKPHLGRIRALASIPAISRLAFGSYSELMLSKLDLKPSILPPKVISNHMIYILDYSANQWMDWYANNCRRDYLNFAVVRKDNNTIQIIYHNGQKFDFRRSGSQIVYCRAVSANGRYLAVLYVDALVVWDVATHQIAGVVSHKGYERVVSISVSDDGYVYYHGAVYSISDDAHYQLPVKSCAELLHNSILWYCHNGTVQFFDVKKRSIVKSVKLLGVGETSFTRFESPSLLLSGHSNGTVCLWEAVEMKLLGKVKVHRGAVSRVRVCMQNQMALTRDKHTECLWDISNNQLSLINVANPRLSASGCSIDNDTKMDDETRKLLLQLGATINAKQQVLSSCSISIDDSSLLDCEGQ